MNKNMIMGGALAGLVMAGGIAATVSAQSAASATGLTEEQVIAIALTEVPGEIQNVELEREDGKQVYEVSILTAEGQEMEVEVSADTGDVVEIGQEGDDCGKDRDA